MTPRKHQLTRPLTTLAVAAFALTAAAGTLGVPRGTPDPIGAPATLTSLPLGVPVNGSDPVSAPAIFEDPVGF